MSLDEIKRRLKVAEWIHVYVWLSPFTVHLKQSQHCYLTIPQYKIKVLKNKIKF